MIFFKNMDSHFYTLNWGPRSQVLGSWPTLTLCPRQVDVNLMFNNVTWFFRWLPLPAENLLGVFFILVSVSAF